MQTFMRLTFGIVVATGLLSTGCSNTTTTSTPAMTDDQLEEKIKGRLADNADLRDIDVDADADKNSVTLSGTVTSQTLRTSAVEAAKAANPGLLITDKIDVKPRDVPMSEYTEDMAREERERATSTGDKVGTSLSDAWIHTKISSKLVSDGDTPARKINVDVDNGTVTLRGSVGDAKAKEEAGRIAKETEGVKRVTNQLKIGE